MIVMKIVENLKRRDEPSLREFTQIRP